MENLNDQNSNPKENEPMLGPLMPLETGSGDGANEANSSNASNEANEDNTSYDYPVMLNIAGTISEAFVLTFQNLFPLLGVVILWLLTCWIPYLNIGTTIALANLPIEIAKGKMINPLSIFDSKYRMFLGEYFLLSGFMLVGIIAGLLLGIIPGIVVSISWCMAVYIMFDKKVSPTDALTMSTKATMGNKFRNLSSV